MAFEQKTWVNVSDPANPPADALVLSADHMNRIEQGIADAHQAIEDDKIYADNTFARIKVGSYIGTGTYGSDNPNTLAFDGKPLFVAVLPDTVGFILPPQLFAINGQASSNTVSTSNSNQTVGVVLDWTALNSVSWYCTEHAGGQLNAEGVKYYYIAFMLLGGE